MSLPLIDKLLKPGSWGRRLLFIGLPLLLALFVANHAEFYLRQHRAAVADAQPVVHAERGATGHRTIGIDESAMPTGDTLFLKFTTLGAWDFDRNAPSPCPPPVQKLTGRQVSCMGFMYPLMAGSELKTFLLLRTTQTCCYGPRPQYNQYLLVEMKDPVKFERLTPVIVKGKFFPDPQPSQGFIYRMEGQSITPVLDEQPDLDPAQAAKSSGLPLFDFSALSDVRAKSTNTLPGQLLALQGKQVIVAGYLLDRSDSPKPQILVGNEWWDGVSLGSPPTIYNAVAVFPADSSQMPPVWKEKGLFTGVLHVETDPAQWSKAGIVSLRQARRGLSGPQSSRPLLGLAWEIVLLCILLSLSLWGGRLPRKDRVAHDLR